MVFNIEWFNQKKLNLVDAIWFNTMDLYNQPCINIYIYIHTIPYQVILAVVKGSQGKCRLSAYVLKRAILHFYSKGKLFPKGVVAELESVQDWALKTGKALRRLVNWLYKSTLFLFSVCFFLGKYLPRY